MTVLGARETESTHARIRLGRHRARDGTVGGRVRLSVERPHAAVVVGKRGSGKSHTLGVLAEGVADTPGLTAVVVDPMGEFTELAPAAPPQIPATAVPPRVWPELVGLSPDSPAGGLVWAAVERAGTLAGGLDALADETGPAARVARNHLRRAARWDVFDPDGRTIDGETTRVVDCAGLARPAVGAVCLAVARACYDRQLADDSQLPWLFVDEAHVAFDTVAGTGLRRLFTRGRTPGVSVVCATQRPTAVPPVVVSQADLLIAHRLTSGADIDRLLAARPHGDRLDDRVPTTRGTALVVDDATTTPVCTRIRDRRTPDCGASPTASAAADN